MERLFNRLNVDVVVATFVGVCSLTHTQHRLSLIQCDATPIAAIVLASVPLEPPTDIGTRLSPHPLVVVVVVGVVKWPLSLVAPRPNANSRLENSDEDHDDGQEESARISALRREVLLVVVVVVVSSQ